MVDVLCVEFPTRRLMDWWHQAVCSSAKLYQYATPVNVQRKLDPWGFFFGILLINVHEQASWSCPLKPLLSENPNYEKLHAICFWYAHFEPLRAKLTLLCRLCPCGEVITLQLEARGIKMFPDDQHECVYVQAHCNTHSQQVAYRMISSKCSSHACRSDFVQRASLTK